MSLKVIENGTIRKLGYSFLFAFHSNYGYIFSCFDTVHERDGQTDRQTDNTEWHTLHLCIAIRGTQLHNDTEQLGKDVRKTELRFGSGF